MLTGDRIVPRPAEKPPLEETSRPSRIEEIGARLALLYRQYDDLDQLCTDIAGGDDDVERRCTEMQAENAKKRICDDMTVLSQALAMEQPKTAKELFICLLHIISPAGEGFSGIPEDARYEQTNAEIASRMLGAMVPGLEALAGVTRAELGCTGAFFESFGRGDTNDALISEMRKLASQKEAAS